MLKFIKISTIFILISLSLFSNEKHKIDSLLNALEDSKGEQRMELLRQITGIYLYTSVEDAIIYANELYNLAEEAENLRYLDPACSCLGEAYFYLDNIDKSIEYYKKFLEINIKQEDIDGIASAYNNLGIVYRHIEDYETSIQYYIESLAIKEKLKDSLGLSSTINNIGVLYFYMGDYDKALEYYTKSLKIENSLENQSGIATSFLNIGEIYSKTNKYDQALSYFQRSIEISESIDDLHTLEINYKCLYDMYKQRIDFQKALYYYELYNEFRNNRLNQESKKEIAEIEIQYETHKKQKEIELLNKQNELNQTIIIILSIAFIVFIVLIILLYQQGLAKKKALDLLSIKNQQITEQSIVLDKLNTTKDKFFSIISHDLKGAIGGFLSQTEFLAEDFDNLPPKDMHDLILKMNQSSEQLYSLLENLLEWSRTQTGSIKVNRENFKLKDLVENILPIFKAQLHEKEIKPIVKIAPELTVCADINMISTVFRNLITNAIKFSHPKSSFIINSTIENDLAKIEITDHGIGISEKNLLKLFNIDQSFSNPGTNREKGSGLGLIICKEFIELNGGEIWVDSEYGNLPALPCRQAGGQAGGSTFTFTLKIA